MPNLYLLYENYLGVKVLDLPITLYDDWGHKRTVIRKAKEQLELPLFEGRLEKMKPEIVKKRGIFYVGWSSDQISLKDIQLIISRINYRYKASWKLVPVNKAQAKEMKFKNY
jgi:hypothetical protein